MVTCSHIIVYCTVWKRVETEISWIESKGQRSSTKKNINRSKNTQKKYFGRLFFILSPTLSPSIFLSLSLCLSLSQGTQYFDSGEYAIQASRKERQKIASNPKPVFNPALARLQNKPLVAPQTRKQHPVASSLATSNVSKVEQWSANHNYENNNLTLFIFLSFVSSFNYFPLCFVKVY